jgi:DNA polymerase-3 subunit epsilon/ATP-dependent DNA helicase DinG
MPQTIVAIDLETTGLDPHRDAIIEIGAVKFKGERHEGEFQTLVNPGRPIPANITQLTGITNDMVANAPRLSEVLPKLQTFVGEAAVLGHNIRFDAGFLNAKGLLKYNTILDTYELAAVLLPTAGRYNLGALAKELGIILPATHRALDDVRVTVAVYQALTQRALSLPLEVLAEITNLSQDIANWNVGQFFEDALRARSKEKVTARKARGASGPLFGQEKPGAPPLKPTDEMTPLNAEELTTMLEPGGPFAKHFPGYEYRSEQVEMLRSVAHAFSEGRHLMVEAGTGTGKSFGYLIPAVHWAMQNGQRVVVSTNTINLQEQLVKKDIPDLQAALGLNFRAALLKGRGNYLCPRRVDNMRKHRPKTAEEMRVLAKVLVWLSQSEADGPHGDISLGPIDRGGWSRLSAEDENCTLEACRERMHGACPFYRARKDAEAAHVLIVNHALLLADIATDGHVLPPYHYLVLDEAHHLEAATTEGLSFEMSRVDLERQLKDLGGPNSGLLGEMLSSAREALSPERYLVLETEANSAYEHATHTLALTRDFFEGLAAFLEEQREGKPVGDYGQQVRITPGVRALPHWSQIEIQWDQLHPALVALVNAVSRIRQALVEWDDDEWDEREDLAASVGLAARFYASIVENVSGLVLKPDPAKIYWMETANREKRISLHAAPLHVGPLVEKHLWNAKESVVMTSATLTAGGEFDYLKGRLSARDAEEVAVGSPFNYEASTLLYLATDMPEPQVKFEYQKALERGLIDLCKATRGRALVLFTSYAQLKQTAQVIRQPLQRAGIDVYDQSDGTSRTMLLDSFKTSEGGVLLGTKSFWEGVDVPGEALSVLVITKLPFDVPSDPIIAARSETFERPFDEYNLPEAVLKFRQGFGRLIRTKSDRGVVVVLDKRIMTKGYGRLFLESLPRCTVRRGPLAQLPKEAAKWIDG